MADTNYPLGGQGVYEKQGGKELVVGSTGTITVESGGAIALEDGGHFAMPVTVKSTSTGTITNYGVTTFGSTSADAYTLAAPTRAGLLKILACTVHGATTTASVITTASTNSYIRGSSSPGDTHTITFLDGGTFAQLVSVSTSEWRVMAMSAADVAIS